MTLRNGIFNPRKRSLHFHLSVIKNNRKDFENASLIGASNKRKWVKSSVALLYNGEVALSVSLSQGIPP